MIRKTLERIDECLKFYDEDEDPQHRDKLFWVRKLMKGINDNIAMEFSLYWLTWIDESMAAFHYAHAPGHIALNRKPHALDNEHYTIVFYETKTFLA